MFGLLFSGLKLLSNFKLSLDQHPADWMSVLMILKDQG